MLQLLKILNIHNKFHYKLNLKNLINMSLKKLLIMIIKEKDILFFILYYLHITASLLQRKLKMQLFIKKKKYNIRINFKFNNLQNKNLYIKFMLYSYFTSIKKICNQNPS